MVFFCVFSASAVKEQPGVSASFSCIFLVSVGMGTWEEGGSR